MGLTYSLYTVRCSFILQVNFCPSKERHQGELIKDYLQLWSSISYFGWQLEIWNNLFYLSLNLQHSVLCSRAASLELFHITSTWLKKMAAKWQQPKAYCVSEKVVWPTCGQIQTSHVSSCEGGEAPTSWNMITGGSIDVHVNTAPEDTQQLGHCSKVNYGVYTHTHAQPLMVK